jgi:predicted permease
MNIASTLAALVPIFLLIGLGYAMQVFRFPGGAFWPLAERFMYFFLFPVLLVKETANASIGQYEPLVLIATLLLALLAMLVLTLALRPILGIGGPAFTSVFQGAMRFNTYVGLAAALALYGTAGVGLFAVTIAVCVPILNVMCVAVLLRYAGEAHNRIDPVAQLRVIASNPLIVACVLGIALNLAGIRLPAAINVTADVLGKSSIALGLMAVGVALDFKVLHAGRWPLLLMSSLKLVAFPLVMFSSLKLIAFPLVMFGIATALGLEGLGCAVVVLWAALPTSAASYVLARQLGGDAQLMAAGVTAETVLAAITVPVMLAVLT